MKLNKVKAATGNGSVKYTYYLEHMYVDKYYVVEEFVYDGGDKDYIVSNPYNIEYLPNIYYNRFNNEFEVGTTSYGCMDTAEMENLITALSNGNNVARFLNKFFFNK